MKVKTCIQLSELMYESYDKDCIDAEMYVLMRECVWMYAYTMRVYVYSKYMDTSSLSLSTSLLSKIQGWPLFKIPSEEVVVAKRKNKPNKVVYALRKELYMSDMWLILCE
jgi:hypothetical protein